MLDCTHLPTEEDIKFFDENGYWVSPVLVEPQRLEQLRNAMDRVYSEDFETGRAPWGRYWRKGDNERGLRKTDNSHWSNLTLRALATDPVIGYLAARLMQTNCIRLWHDQLLFKPGRNTPTATANVGWHQDRSYWQCTVETTLVTAWVAFDDVTLENGCMQVVPRSHRWGLVNENDFFEQDLERQSRQMRIPEGEQFSTAPIVMKAGQVSFHHCLTLHGSGPNTTANPRRSLAIHLMTGNLHYKKGTPSEGHMNVHLLAPKQDGELFAGDWFPVLYHEPAVDQA